MGSDEDIKISRRFPFGKNWQRFLDVLKEEHIDESQKALCGFLGKKNLDGVRFLDIGSGSGLHSLAARRLGATVFSFDYDPDSVSCTLELKRRYFPEDEQWTARQGSILDRTFLQSLGTFDICYAWGVLHHTDRLWQALYNAQLPVKDDGLLFIAIYNDQGIISTFWHIVKLTYCSGLMGRVLMTLIFYPLFWLGGLLIDLIHLRNPFTRYREHKKYRGMSLVHDWKDWLGGYPYQPARPQEIISYFENLDFELSRFEPTGHGFGNNQFLFRKTSQGVSGNSQVR